VAVDPGTRSKVQRAYLIQGTTEAGRVHLPHESVFPWVADAVKELEAFPFGKFDDRVDVLTQALLYIKANGASSLARKLRALSRVGEIGRFRAA
jgi:predicted phage terminase large subunit-like protein